jgi:hypothetical protein
MPEDRYTLFDWMMVALIGTLMLEHLERARELRYRC